MNKVFLNSVGTAVPVHRIIQSDMYRAVDDSSELERKERLILRNIYNSSGIESRYSVIEEFTGDEIFKKNADKGIPSLGRRMKYFEKHAIGLCKQAFSDCVSRLKGFEKKEISHVIAFSCTGMYAPGLDIQIIEEMGLNQEAERTNINFMGCYAAINALKSAYHIARSKPDAKILLVGVELCSLHYLQSNDQEQIIANAIFSDGAAAAIISCDPDLKSGICPSIELKGFYSDFFSSGKDEMVWSIGDSVFNLRLSAAIPDILKEKTAGFFERLLSKAGLKKEEIHYYAIHPGGMKILEACEHALDLSREENKHSYEVLRKYGNMSSVTILFVLKEYFNILNGADQGKNMIACAFGPGITMESMQLKIG